MSTSEEDPRQGDVSHAEEPEQGFMRELSQFLIVPSLVVLLCVAIFVMFGLLTSEDKTAREFLQEVRSGQGNDRWQAAFELSRLIAQQPDLGRDETLTGEIVAVIENEGAHDPLIRKYLIIALENLGNPGAAPTILKLLGDADPDVRLQAARAASTLEGVEEAVEPLAALLQEEDPAMRKVATYALGQTKDEAAIEHLLPRLEDPSEDVRWNAAVALAVLGDASGRDVIAQMLDRGHLDAIEGISESQKVNALINGVQAVYLLRDREMLERIRDLSREDPSLNVRQIAMEAVEAIEAEQDR